MQPPIARTTQCISTLIPSSMANPLAPTEVISPVLLLCRHRGLVLLLDSGAEHTGMLVGTQATSVRHNSPLSPGCPLRLVTWQQKRGLKEVTPQMFVRKTLPKSERRGG